MKQTTLLIALSHVLPIAGVAGPDGAKQEKCSPDPDLALQPAHVIISPWPRHVPPTTRQGVPGIERTARGRLWTVYGRDVIYDYNRTPDGAILMATFREDDVRAGEPVTDRVRLQAEISRLTEEL